jgi:uncharacterized protein YceK
MKWRGIGDDCWSAVEYIAAFVLLCFCVAIMLGGCGCARTLEYCEDGSCAGAAGAGGTIEQVGGASW